MGYEENEQGNWPIITRETPDVFECCIFQHKLDGVPIGLNVASTKVSYRRLRISLLSSMVSGLRK
jgi:hypothetical protein